MGGGKLYIEMGLVIVLGMMCLSMPTMPSVVAQAPAPAPAHVHARAPAPAQASSPSELAKELHCWDKIGRCINSTFNETSLLDIIEPTFNVSHVLCCSVIQQQVKAEKDCFCRGALAVADVDRLHSNSMNQVLSTCNVTSPVHALCSGAIGRQIGWVMLFSILFTVCSSLMF